MDYQEVNEITEREYIYIYIILFEDHLGNYIIYTSIHLEHCAKYDDKAHLSRSVFRRCYCLKTNFMHGIIANYFS